MPKNAKAEIAQPVVQLVADADAKTADQTQKSTWSAPTAREIAVGMEINMYVRATR